MIWTEATQMKVANSEQLAKGPRRVLVVVIYEKV